MASRHRAQKRRRCWATTVWGTKGERLLATKALRLRDNARARSIATMRRPSRWHALAAQLATPHRGPQLPRPAALQGLCIGWSSTRHGLSRTTSATAQARAPWGQYSEPVALATQLCQAMHYVRAWVRPSQWMASDSEVRTRTSTSPRLDMLAPSNSRSCGLVLRAIRRARESPGPRKRLFTAANFRSPMRNAR
jgi:hypothetical protein